MIIDDQDETLLVFLFRLSVNKVSDEMEYKV